ncbi:hypothetical protein F511_08945 [Dorcoceras hygrometricum]|uniref:Uncharacterized protein n=1 Tax=Dorcoceras hygrometricum TaxID=472368 RepID=A0A2Z7CY02_9LAMI|nr:hypothetical protein F511_08945 [Dorcoceras hygrometricum]
MIHSIIYDLISLISPLLSWSHRSACFGARFNIQSASELVSSFSESCSRFLDRRELWVVVRFGESCLRSSEIGPSFLSEGTTVENLYSSSTFLYQFGFMRRLTEEIKEKLRELLLVISDHLSCRLCRELLALSCWPIPERDSEGVVLSSVSFVECAEIP